MTIEELQAKAFQVNEKVDYMVSLDEEQVQELKTELPTLLLETEGMEQQFKAYKKTKGDEIKEKKNRAKAIYHAIEFGEIEECDDLYLVQDFDNGKMNIYNSKCILIEVRDLLPEEMQKRM